MHSLESSVIHSIRLIKTFHVAAPRQENGNKMQDDLQGVRLGDWIFNNSSENYETLNKGRSMYRTKICENWVISLEKPKPKDVNDSLSSVAINRTAVPQDDHLFKKPQPRTNRKRTTGKNSQIKPTPHVSTQMYRPSQQIKAFDNSSLIRASRKLILKTSVSKKRKNSAKNRIESQMEMHLPKTLKLDGKKYHKRKSFENVNQESIQLIDTIPHVTFENLNDPTGILKETFEPPIYMEDLEDRSSDHFNIYKSTENKLDFKLHKSKRTTNFNMNFSSSIAIHTVNDAFMGFLQNDVSEVNAISTLFETNVPSANSTPFSSRQHELNRPTRSSIYSETSELRYRHRRNDSILTHHRQQTYCNFNSNNSLNSNRNEISSGGVSKSRPPKSIQSSSDAGTAVAPIGRTNSSLGPLSDNIHQSGWPVTININFGQTK